jgi:hypothetical protein
MFLTDGSKPLWGGSARARALNTWRDAEQLVSTRWQTFLHAEPETRAWAFASYVAALDAEEAAAVEMAGLTSPAAKAA